MSRSNRSISATRRGSAAASARNGSASEAWPLPWTMIRAPVGEQVRGTVRQEVEALLGIHPADHAQHDPVVGRVEADAGEQIRAAGRLAGRVPRRVRRGERRVGGGVPGVGVDAVEDAPEAIAHGRAAHRRGPCRRPGVRASRAKPGDTVFDQVCTLDRGQQQVEAVRVGAREAVTGRQAQLTEVVRGRQPW